MIDRFTKYQFETALPIHNNTGQPLWEPRGLEDGEFVYYMPIDPQSGILIRSSIDCSGIAADTGNDSIRAWLAKPDGSPLGSKVSRWTTRMPGWGDRLKEVLRTLWGWRKKAGNCPTCCKPKLVFKVKKEGPNRGRIFAKCEQHNHWTWLT